MHIDYVHDNFQSVIPKFPKSQFDTLECTLEELAVLKLIYKNPSIKQTELVAETGKSLSTVKRIMESLQKKDYICRVNGKRYGKWEVLIKEYLVMEKRLITEAGRRQRKNWEISPATQ